MSPATYILLLVLGWLALSLAVLWAMLRLARRARPYPTSLPRLTRKMGTSSPVATRKHLTC
ncbi:hypothetical protein [Pseudomonas sp. EpS/L25]|uniref:hypothetical protein n=1 Tax=Pseudomonas sp. EpS/L25 TaxID=1749078 RepID=UPI0007437B9A|nr:hypothetical protein [Pseudomonas sp. EpS/L25]KUM43567.1 hypothetical protein AR540_17400 [Pseudomonas sp. EpS/L25]